MAEQQDLQDYVRRRMMGVEPPPSPPGPAPMADYVMGQTGVAPDVGRLGTPLANVAAGPLANHMAEAHAAMNLTPQEKFLYQTHLDNLQGTGKVVHPNGSISSLLQMTFDKGGRTWSIPTVWNGQALPPDAAISMAEQTGGLERFPSYASGDEAEARYQQLHDYLGQDTADWIARQGGQ
jgi:hypothetical protein